MKIGEDFEQIGTLDAGELVMKYPGVDLKMPYESGNAFLSRSGIGYVSLAIRDAYIQETDETSGISRRVKRMMSEKFSSQSLKQVVKQILAERDHSLFYSKTKKGIEVLSLPGAGDDDVISQMGEKIIVASYNTVRVIPSAESVYALHKRAIGKRTLITDRAQLEKEVLQLVPKANGVYERGLELIRQLGL